LREISQAETPTDTINIEDTSPEPSLYVAVLAIWEVILSRGKKVGNTNNSIFL
jgi:hypothetical protein